jgi:hypothetical protein
MADRKAVLLRAAYDLLTKLERSHYVVEAASVTTFYDGANCDGYCLRDDIAAELNLDDDTDPLVGENDQED